MGLIMPAMPRMKGKAQKIAYAILGLPTNMEKNVKKSKKDKHIEHMLVFDETSRVK